MKTWRVGVIGAGYAAEHHLPALQSLPNVRVVALADVDASLVRSKAARHGITRHHEDGGTLIEDPTVDVVAVLTPPSTHLDLCRAALGARKPLMVEKPITADLESARSLARQAQDAQLPATIAFCLRYHPLVRESRDLVLRGRLGRIESVRGMAGSPANLGAAHRRRRVSGGGALIELGVHVYDLWRFLLGGEVAEITAVSHSDSTCEDLHSIVTARFTSGELVTSVLTLNSPGHDFEIVGSQARLAANLYRFDGLRLIRGTGGDPRDRLADVGESLHALRRGFGARRWGGVFLSMFREQWRSFLGAVENGDSVTPTLQDGVRSLEIALAAVAAADSGRAVTLNPDRS